MSDLPIPADDFESVLEDYPIKLEHFEGPLDLLLHLNPEERGRYLRHPDPAPSRSSIWSTWT